MNVTYVSLAYTLVAAGCITYFAGVGVLYRGQIRSPKRRLYLGVVMGLAVASMPIIVGDSISLIERPTRETWTLAIVLVVGVILYDTHGVLWGENA